MFDTVRKHQKILQIVLMLFIVPSFVMFGVSSYTGFFDKETDLVKVNGRAITAQEVENAATVSYTHLTLPTIYSV